MKRTNLLLGGGAAWKVRLAVALMAFCSLSAAADKLDITSTLPWEGNHSLDDSSWGSKIVVHPEAFNFSTTGVDYYVKISASQGGLQLGFATWSGDKESWIGEVAQTDANDYEYKLSNSYINHIQNDGYCFQINNNSGTVYKIELVTKEKEPEPDYGKGFHTDGTKLLDAYDNEFVMRGLNYSYAWQESNSWCIKSTSDWGCNAIRINLGDGSGDTSWLHYTDYNTLQGLIEECKKYHLVGVFSPHDETGNNSKDALMKAVSYWKGMKNLMNENIAYALLNISNEWMQSEDTEAWSEAYVEAINELRGEGIKNTIIIDVHGYGQGAAALRETYTDANGNQRKYAQDIIDADAKWNDGKPNIMFSIHMYHVSGQNEQVAVENIDGGLALNVPLLLGELAFEHKAHKAWPEGGPVAWEKIHEYAAEKKVSWLAWSWTGNGGDAETCDMFDSNGYIIQNGKCMIDGKWGIKRTAVPCTVYNNAVDQKEVTYPTMANDWKYYNGNDYVYLTPGLVEGGEDNPGGDTGDTGDDKYQGDNPGTSDMPFDVGSWEKEFYVYPIFFQSIYPGGKIQLTIESKGSAQIQWFYNDEYKAKPAAKAPMRTHYTVGADYQDIDSGIQEYDVTDENIEELRQHGIGIKGQNYVVTAFNYTGRPTGVEKVEIDYAEPYEIYTLQGVRVSEMTRGQIYIVRQGAKAVKLKR